MNIVPDPADRSLAARLAAGFGMPQTAVAIARRAGVEGVVLLDAGWPDPVTLPPGGGVEPALVLGVIRQESSFDTTTVSPAGAAGLMQLMPGTASLVARQDRPEPSAPGKLIGDPEYNMQLGTAYLRAMLDQFDGCIPLAVAAYNAGPRGVQEWLATYGDPRQSGRGDDRLDRAHPVRRDAQLRAAGDRERSGLSRPQRRGEAASAGAMAALRLARQIASGFGCGAVPGAPGTAASLAATLLGAALLAVSSWALALAALAAVGVGIWAIARVGPRTTRPGS